jgi:hypothetical protein
MNEFEGNPETAGPPWGYEDPVDETLGEIKGYMAAQEERAVQEREAEADGEIQALMAEYPQLADEDHPLTQELIENVRASAEAHVAEGLVADANDLLSDPAFVRHVWENDMGAGVDEGDRMFIEMAQERRSDRMELDWDSH